MTKAKEGDIDTHLAVEAFQSIRKHGQQIDGEFHYGGLFGSTDFDGYTVFLRDQNVELTVFFKHRFSLVYSKSEDLDLFKRKIEAVINGHEEH
jgi:hypothetical protein